MPNIKQLTDSIIDRFQANMGVVIPNFGKNFLRVVAGVDAAQLKQIYLSIDFFRRNTLPDRADSETQGGTSERWGRVKLGRNRRAATQGRYEIELVGQVGATIEPGTQFKSRENSASPDALFIYEQAAQTFTSNELTIEVRALEAGLNSRLEVGDEVAATVPLDNINQLADVTAVIEVPIAAESIEAYRSAVLNSFRLEPQGGAPVDYRLWADDVAGVVNTYPYNEIATPNTVRVFVETTIANSVDGKRTPDSNLLNEVDDAIKLNPDDTLPLRDRGRLPLTTSLIVVGTQPQDVEITISDVVGLTSEREAAIKQQIISFVDTIRPTIDGIPEDVLSTLTLNAVISQVTQAVPGLVFGSVTLSIDGTPINSYTFDLGQIPFIDETQITITPA